jgi:deazaflavin-dependent oxidoreductase (nitroreductase family)
MTMTEQQRYLRPGRFDRFFNGAVHALSRIGIHVAGARVLSVRGRASGEWRSTPVNPLTLHGERYIVAPRGTTQWVRNLRAAGTGRLLKGSKVEEFRGVELTDDQKPEILRLYLRKWAWEVGRFFEDLDADADDARLLEVAPGFPVFRVDKI